MRLWLVSLRRAFLSRLMKTLLVRMPLRVTLPREMLRRLAGTRPRETLLVVATPARELWVVWVLSLR